MGTDKDPSVLCDLKCIQESLIIMAPVDKLQTFIVYRLEAVLYKNKVLGSEILEHFDLFVVDCIGPGADSQTLPLMVL